MCFYGSRNGDTTPIRFIMYPESATETNTKGTTTMATIAHHGSELVTGKIRQIRHILAGKAVVVRKGQAKSQDTTEYLLANEANKHRLQEGIAELERGEGALKPLR